MCHFELHVNDRRAPKAELERFKEIHTADMRHLNETKQMLVQSHEIDKDAEWQWYTSARWQ